MEMYTTVLLWMLPLITAVVLQMLIYKTCVKQTPNTLRPNYNLNLLTIN